MKSVILICAILFLADSYTIASQTNLFSIDEKKVSEAMVNIERLELYVQEHGQITLAELRAYGYDFPCDLILRDNLDVMALFDLPDPPPQLQAFWKGLIYHIRGVRMVYEETEDVKLTITAFIGCLSCPVFIAAPVLLVAYLDSISLI